MPIAPGTKLGPYEIVAPLGAGGMGEVFRARDPRIGRDVAIKVMPPAFAADEDRLRRFEQEARTAGTLNHPNLVTIYDIGRENGAAYLVMELLDGETLRERLARDRGDLKKILLGLADAADAVAAAHRAGVVHRDLKPENIMVTGSGFIKILDFGLAKLTGAPEQTSDTEPTAVIQTDSGVVLGTVGYMSPEQAMGRAADPRSDIFSLGCILYEAVTGQRAFAGKSSVDTLHDIIHSDPTPVRALRPDVPPELQRIIRKCLTKDPDERYQSAKDLAIDLRAAVRELGSAPDVYAAAPPRRRWAMWIAAAIVVAVAVAATQWFLARGRRGAARTPTIRPLTTSGEVISACISPDGKYIAYATSAEGIQALWLRQIGTAQSIQLVPPQPLAYWGHTFARDGASIYYGIKSPAPGQTDGVLFRIDTLGGTPRRILDGIDSVISFSPDGARIAYLRAHFPKSGQSAVMIAGADGSNPRPLAVKTAPDLFAPIFFGGPAWSPDGKTIVAPVIRTTGTEYGRFDAIDVASGAERALTHEQWRFTAQACWLPDGKSLVGVAATTGQPAAQLVTIDYPSGDARPLTSGVSDWRHPSLTLDGSKLVAVGASRYNNINIFAPGGAQPRRVSTTQFDGIYGVSFAPDGRLVFTTLNGAGGADLIVAAADGSNRQQVPMPSQFVREAVATADGAVVAVLAENSGVGIWRMGLDGSAAKRVAQATATSVATVSPDGGEIYFDANLGNGDTIYRVSSRGGPARPVSPLHATAPCASPDGKSLGAIVSTAGKPPHLGVIDVTSGALLREFDSAIPSSFTRCRWSPDGATIFYNVGSFLYAAPAAGGAPRVIQHYDSPTVIDRFDVAHDGTLAVVSGLLTRDAYLITGFE